MSVNTYASMQAELDQVLEWFNSENLDVDEALKKYQEAQKLIEKMEKYLKTAENKIQTIKLNSQG